MFIDEVEDINVQQEIENGLKSTLSFENSTDNLKIQDTYLDNLRT